MPNHFNPILSPFVKPYLSFFNPPENLKSNRMIFSWTPQMTVCQQQPQPNYHPSKLQREGREEDRTFTEIANLNEVALMRFLEILVKKYIFHYQTPLKKFFIDIRPPINRAVMKFTVVISPTLKEPPERRI